MEDGKLDVVVCGGGLAGLTLARQLRREVPAATVTVVEPERRPLPEACHKVGESSVELGTHYLATFLDLKEYLAREHLPKNGLRFFSAPQGTPLWERTEIGPAEPPIVPSYQMDRGKLENDLRAMCEGDGVILREGWKVQDIAIDGESGHRVTIAPAEGGDTQVLRARWVVDASGRRQLLQRKHGLRRPSVQRASAAWFRIGRRLKVGELVPPTEERWHARDVDDNRWLSTVHLCGEGYWAWLIPLSTGHTSVGIVTDHVHHRFTDYNKPDRALAWLAKHEPELAAALRPEELEDFRVMHDYSYSSERVFSEERWACVGEAGLFADPLYSPGTDLIGFANSLTTELVRRDLCDGELDPARVELYNRAHIDWSGDTTLMLADNGVIFTRPEVFGAKLWWDFFHYWSFICPYFFSRCYQLPEDALRAAHEVGRRYYRLNDRAQHLFEAWAELVDPRSRPRPFVPLPMFPSFLADQHLSLQEPRSAEEALARAEADLPKADAVLTELLIRALYSVGAGGAQRLGEGLGLSDWAPPLDPARLALDRLPRAERKARLPSLARDLERALGPQRREEALEDLALRAGWPTAPAPDRAAVRLDPSA